ncbi:MAG TPA: hypothetical protein VNO82_20715 [Solirubrobacteraceae bacterium]|nr:hypothetical protein [Solirubrobacteraceae bacterium]
MRALALALAMLVAIPAVAGAETWRGKTGQGRAVAVRTGDNDRVERVRVSWKAKCRKGSYMSRTVFRRPFDVGRAAEFEDGGTYRVDVPGGYRARHRVFVRGTLADGEWTGTFRVRTRVTRDGRFVDNCRLRRVRWSAERV